MDRTCPKCRKAEETKRGMDGTCPKCHKAEETLGHVLNACTPNAGLMRDRHNNVLKRLVKAIPSRLATSL